MSFQIFLKYTHTIMETTKFAYQHRMNLFFVRTKISLKEKISVLV